MALLTAEDIALQFRGRTLFEDATVSVEHRDRMGIIGANGTGKSTLMRIMVGAMIPDGGRITRARGIRVGYLPQELPDATGGTLLGSVLAAAPGVQEVEARLKDVETELGSATDPDEMLELSEELSDLHSELADLERNYGRHRAERILVGLRFRPEEMEKPLSAFSGGWRMRAALAGLLFQNPDVLFLDEPTNHLDMPSVHWLNGFLQAYKHALVLICHDREFLNRHVSRVVSLEVEGVRSYRGNYDEYKVQRALEIELLENRAKNEEAKKKELEAFVERFRAKATKARQAQSRAKIIEKMVAQQVDVPIARRAVSLHFPPTARAGDTVIDVDQVSHAYGPKKVLNDVRLAARRGDRIAIVGLNGAGKTTLLKIVAGELKPSAGAVKLGHNVDLSYYAQHHADVLRKESTILDEVWRAKPDLSQTEARGVCGAFLFSGDDVDKAVGVLSGGEKARVALARLLVRPGNLLLLDEPTNHLDTESAEKLTASLESYDGTLLFVSHNLDFARRLSNKVWDVHDGIVEVYPGSLGEYLDHLAALEAVEDGVDAGDGKKAQLPDDKQGRIEARQKQKQAESERRKLQKGLEKRVQKAEEAIARLEAERATLEAALGDPATHGDAAKAKTTSLRFEACQRELEAAMAEWESAGQELATLQE
ncbi:MAG: ABC-F family ATP-binding cassette domain-containing protein [Myxococcota bacterium]